MKGSALEALQTELLGDVGKLHALVAQLKADLPQIAGEIRRAAIIAEETAARQQHRHDQILQAAVEKIHTAVDRVVAVEGAVSSASAHQVRLLLGDQLHLVEEVADRYSDLLQQQRAALGWLTRAAERYATINWINLVLSAIGGFAGAAFAVKFLA